MEKSCIKKRYKTLYEYYLRVWKLYIAKILHKNLIKIISFYKFYRKALLYCMFYVTKEQNVYKLKKAQQWIY